MAFGRFLRLDVRGASHARKMTFSIENFPAGVRVDAKKLAEFMERRAPGRDKLSTARRETDEVVWRGGVKRRGGNAADLVTTGETVVGEIASRDMRPADYGAERTVPRPGHADFGQWIEMGRIPTGGGKNSGRLTAPLCAAGALCLEYLAQRGIFVQAKVESIRGKCAADDMTREIERAKKAGDSVGGTISCEVTGLPPGLGGALSDGLECGISSAVFTIPGVKGVFFGEGCTAEQMCQMRGSQYNDPFSVVKDGLVGSTMRQGGIMGGRTYGMPVCFTVAMRPTPTVFVEQDSVDLATIIYAWDYMLSWSLAMDYRQLDPPECLQAGSFYPIVSDPWRSYLRHYHHTGEDIPHMLFRCRGRTPFSYNERVDWQISSTYYYCELTTNDDATATLKLNYVLFEHTTSNAYSLTRPLFYGERVTGEAQAEGTAYGVALSGLRTKKTCIMDGEFWRDVYIPSTGETKHCCITPCVYKIAEERSFGTKLDYLYRLKKYAITKRANYENVGFPAATSAYDRSNVWTLYQYDSDGSDYYGNPATYSGKGIESSGSVATNDPYYVDHYFNSQAFDSDIYYMSEALHPSVGIEVYYDQGDPEFTLGPFTVPNHPDMCIVTSNHRADPDHPGVRVVDVEGWMYTNDWNFVEDPGAWWDGAGPTMTEIVYPQYYEKDGDAIYELFPWQLPFTFAVDMLSKWVSNRWGMWE